MGSVQTFDNAGNLASSTGGKTIEQLIAEESGSPCLGGTSSCVAERGGFINLNRNINKTQEITKDTITGALDVSVTVDNRVFSSTGREQMGGEFLNQGKNILISNLLRFAWLFAKAIILLPIVKKKLFQKNYINRKSKLTKLTFPNFQLL